jgi:hypothetical protein
MISNAAPHDATASVISLQTRRIQLRGKSRQLIKAAAVFALCFLGLIGSFADDAVARTGLLVLSGTESVDPNSLEATLVWATIANLAVCAAIVLMFYWLLSRPTAEIVELRSRRPQL